MGQDKDDRSQQQTVEDEVRKALQRSIDWQDGGGDAR